MSALFPRWSNSAIRITLALLGAAAMGGLGFLMLYVRSPLFLNMGHETEQPVQFDHRHHVADDGIDCRYCHQTVERAPSAGYPATGVCMNCHSQIWNKSPLTDIIRTAYFSDRPIPWVRLHQLPDFVYFNHSIHIRQGVGCVTCHGRVDQMPALRKVEPQTMSWCINCHRNPEKYLRPREEVTNLAWTPPDGDQEKLGRELVEKYGVHTRTSCTTCHR